MSNKEGKRITLKRSRPNALFEEWLVELYEDAKAKKSKLEPMIKEALDSLLKYPLPLKSGAECITLKGFKKKLCDHIDQRLEVYNYNLQEKHDVLRKLRASTILMCYNNGNSNESCTLQNSSTENTQPAQSNGASNSRESSISIADSTPEEPVTSSNGSKKQAQSNAASNSRESDVSIAEPTPEQPINSNNGTKKQSRDKKYIPAYRSGAYAILIALLEDYIEHPGNYLTKQELIDKAQKHSEESFVRPKPDTFYTAWSNMSKLVTKSLVNKVRNKTVKYQLTDKGIELAKQVQAQYQKTPTPNDIIFKAADSTKSVSSSSINVGRNNASSSSSNMVECNDTVDINGINVEHNKVSKTVQVVIDRMTSTKIREIQNNGLAKNTVQKHHSPSKSNSEVCLRSSQENMNNKLMNENSTSLSQIVQFPAGSFDIILLIDKNETGGLSKKNDPTVVQFKKYPDLNHEYRSLKVGDFTWIARHKVHKDQELVLPFIVERKRMDDLGASIKDGRFHEQKFRLRKCSMKVVYLVENYGSNKNVGLPIQNLMQALANTRVQDKFKVHITDSLTHTARFLAMMTKRLTIRYKTKELKGQNGEQKDQHLMTFDYFNKTSAKSKSLTVKATFIKLLLQIKGVSVEKALAITAVYNTPRSLIQAYRKCDQNTGEYLLAHLKYGDLGRKVGPASSIAIYQVFANVWVPTNEL